MRRFLLVVFLAACGNNFVDDIPPDDIAPGDAGFFRDSTIGFDAFANDASDANEDVTKFNGGGPFLCYGCICDGTLNMCVNGGGGGMPVESDASADASFGDASACDPDAAPTSCTQIPLACLPKPTCDCIGPLVAPCECLVDSTGNGFEITCPPKP